MGLDTVELIFKFEEHFQINYKDTDIEQTYTVGQLTQLTCKMINISSEVKPEFEKIFNQFQEFFGVNIQLNDKISNYLKIDDYKNLSNFINLKINNFSTILKYLLLDPHFIKWKNLTVEEFINGILITNSKNLFDNKSHKTIFQVYLTIGYIIKDKIGASVYDIQSYVNISKDLRID